MVYGRHTVRAEIRESSFVGRVKGAAEADEDGTAAQRFETFSTAGSTGGMDGNSEAGSAREMTCRALRFFPWVLMAISGGRG